LLLWNWSLFIILALNGALNGGIGMNSAWCDGWWDFWKSFKYKNLIFLTYVNKSSIPNLRKYKMNNSIFLLLIWNIF
jgi:hypothetical protein